MFERGKIMFQSPRALSAVLTGAVLVASLLYYWQQKGFPQIESNGLLRQKAAVRELKNFSSAIPILEGATVKESYDLVDPAFNQSTEGVVVLQSKQNPTEIQNFYKSNLLSPQFNPVSGADNNDSDLAKTLVYSTSQGLVIIRIEKTDKGSKITIHDRNLLVKLQLTS
ncbi:MAG: hypothetical protein Q7S32_01530 [bacterium]|nr:hypothetical protein [bacterium]